MNTRRPFFQFIAKVLVIAMLCQGLPFSSISQDYQWETEPLKKAFTQFVNFLSLHTANASSSTQNVEQGIFGPKKYLRTTGAPNVYEDFFAAAQGAGILVIRNCEEDSKHRITSGIIIHINGVEIYTPENFKQDVYLMELPLLLNEINNIRIELRSKPGTYLTIEVMQKPPTVDLTADPDTIRLGESSVLTWSSEMASSCFINPDVGAVDLNGSTSVSPEETTTYTITATALAGTATATATITVIPPPKVKLTTPLATILKGESTLLNWTSTNAESCVIEPGIGAVDINGSVIISPEDSTLYTITATGPGGTATSSLDITVLHPPTVSMTATPNAILAGETTTLSWTSTNGNTAVMTQGIGSVPVNGSIEVSPDKTTSYRIVVTGEGGVASADATVTVKHPEPTVSISSDPGTILKGNSSVLTWTSANALNCEISPHIGPVDLNGNITVSPAETTVYTITASNPDHSAVATTTVQVIFEADLKPVNIDLSKTSVDSQTMSMMGTIDVGIENARPSAVDGSYQVTLFEDTNFNSTYDAGMDQIIGSTEVPSGPSGNETITVSIDVDANVQFKGNLVFAFVDSENSIPETNEDNNITHNMADCEYVPPVGSFKPTLEWEWKKSNIRSTSNQVAVTPAVANLNDDNGDGRIDTSDIPDIIFVSHVNAECEINGTLRAISGDGKKELFSITNRDTLPVCNPAVGDIDNDGLVEILILSEYINSSRTQAKVYAFENNGAFKWQSGTYTIGKRLGHAITISDIDADGNPEIIVGKIVLNNNGTKKWVGGGGLGQNHSITVDLDLDGTAEVVAGNTAYDPNGNILWRNSSVSDGFAAAANFDSDPNPEIVIVGGGYVYLLEHTGQKIWGPKDFPPSGTNKDAGGAPTIADFDSDGQPEIGLAGGYRYVVLESNGSVKWTATTQDLSSNKTGSSVFDFEGDGNAEVVYSDERYLFIFRGKDGKVLYKTRIGSRTRTENPIVVDVDNDNNAEIVVSSNSYYGGYKTGIQVFGDLNDTWVNTRKIWNQHAYSITNVNDDGTIPAIPANNWEIFNNFRQNQMLNARGCVDLTSSYLRIDNSDYPNSVTLIARIGNGGVVHTPSGINVTFHNGYPYNGGIPLKTVSISDRIEAGGYKDVSIKWNNPPTGLKTIYVFADDNGSGRGKVAEIDEDNNIASAVFSLGNYTPVAKAGEDQAVVEGDTVFLDGSASYDPEGDPITWQWTIVQRPAGSSAAPSDPTAVKPSFVADVPGIYYVQLVVHDGTTGSYIDMIKVTAKALVTVPDVIGKDQATAESMITEVDLVTGTITEEYSDTVPEGSVISQEPAPGTIIVIESEVSLVISKGVHMVTVPGVIGMAQADAELLITNSVLSVGNIFGEYIDIYSKDHVFMQSPQAGEIVRHHSFMDLVVSLGIWTGVDTTPPRVSINVAPTKVNMGEEVFISVMTADNVGVINRSLTINGLPLALNGNQAVYMTDTPGRFTAEIFAMDGAGLSSTAQMEFVVIDPNDFTPPVVSLHQNNCVEITDLYSVTGSISDDNEVEYTLLYRQQGSSNWQPFAEGNASSINGILGTFDPTILKNGAYEILLFAMDPNGNYATDDACLMLDGNLKLGQVNMAATDITLPAPGFPLTLEREYDSRDTGPGDFGPGWNLPSSNVKPQATTPMGLNWHQGVQPGSIGMTTYIMIEDRMHYVVIRFSDDEVLKFRMRVSPMTSTLYPFENGQYPLSVYYTPVGDTQGSLQTVGADTQLMLYYSKLYDMDMNEYNPTRFKYTRPDGTIFIIGPNGIESMTDVYGHKVTYTNNGITHSSGASITFERGTGNRIETATDVLGYKYVYHYTDGQLTKVTREGSGPGAFAIAASLGYHIEGKKSLKEIKAPDGTVLGQFEYDELDRVTALIDADGNRIIYGYHLPSHVQQMTDRLGNTTVYNYDNKGNVTSKTDPLGNLTEWTYDSRGNKLAETDPLGNTTSFTYDTRNNMLSKTDPLGNKTTYAYNSRNKILTVKDPKSNVTTNTYNGNGDLLTTTDPLGNVTSHTYDSDGNMLSTTDALGNTTTFTYNSKGLITSKTDPLESKTTYTYDAWGNELTSTVNRTTDSGVVNMTTENSYDIKHRLIRTIDPDGYDTIIEYNNINKESAVIDRNGNRTEYEYDGRGNRTVTTYPDGTTTVDAYDAENNKISSTDREGNVTTFEYDVLKQPVRTTLADGAYTQMEYDDAGRMIASIDENGNRTEFEYDDAGRRTKIIDSMGHETVFAYDKNGNQTSITDANSHTTTFTYDELNRKVTTTYPDSSTSSVGYDGLDRKISETDQAGVTTQFEYDALGRLIKVTDALGGVTSYTYDEKGNKRTQTDPNGNTKTWDYDDMGNVVTHTLPLGMFETYTYDPNGNVLSKTDFNGVTRTYDYSPCCNKLLGKYFADGSSVVYTYTANGLKDTITDSRGITDNDYDVRSRLIRVTHPDGAIIEYTYDAAGNRTSVTIPSGTTAYTFDALNRLQTVTDPNSGITSYTYDNVGARASVTYPNGAIASYTYSDLNRLTLLENRRSDNSLISSYAYTLGPAGNRLRVTEHTGRVVDYTYDLLYRLIQEAVTDPVLGNETIDYTYDAFGNRLTKTDSTGTINYVYDENDRLITESGSGQALTYAYDDNGNTLTKSDGASVTYCSYDTENRLMQVQNGGSATSYAYDAQGIRVASETNGALTNYLVDKNRDYAQVLEEFDGTGALTASYAYGDDLISQVREDKKKWVTSYFHYDGQMSTRQLSGINENITDTYTYDAFGVQTSRTGSTANNYLYTGEQHDPNAGFYYLRARYYNQVIGRFVTTDSWEGSIFEPLSLHKYNYTENNPISKIDPTGNTTTTMEQSITMAIMSLLAKRVIPAVLVGVLVAEQPLRLWRYTSKRNVELSRFTGFVVGEKVVVTWWTPDFYNNPMTAQQLLALKYPPQAWISVFIYIKRDLMFGPMPIGPKWNMSGGGKEYWTFKAIPFWSRSPQWGYF